MLNIYYPLLTTHKIFQIVGDRLHPKSRRLVNGGQIRGVQNGILRDQFNRAAHSAGPRTGEGKHGEWDEGKGKMEEGRGIYIFIHCSDWS